MNKIIVGFYGTQIPESFQFLAEKEQRSIHLFYSEQALKLTQCTYIVLTKEADYSKLTGISGTFIILNNIKFSVIREDHENYLKIVSLSEKGFLEHLVLRCFNNYEKSLQRLEQASSKHAIEAKLINIFSSFNYYFRKKLIKTKLETELEFYDYSMDKWLIENSKEQHIVDELSYKLSKFGDFVKISKFYSSDYDDLADYIIENFKKGSSTLVRRITNELQSFYKKKQTLYEYDLLEGYSKFAELINRKTKNYDEDAEKTALKVLDAFLPFKGGSNINKISLWCINQMIFYLFTICEYKEKDLFVFADQAFKMNKGLELIGDKYI